MNGTMMWLILGACGSPEAPAPASGKASAAIDVDDPATCAGCHAAVVAEWEQSQHRRAHHEEDPLFAGMRQWRMELQGEPVANACASCHTPRSVADVQAPAAKTGVSCAACHAVAHVDREAGRGAAALTWTEGGKLLGPHDLPPDASPAHGAGPAPAHLTDGTTLCLACHDATRNPSDVAACTTGPEHAASGSDRSCTSCHMPRVEGPSGTVSSRPDHASHRFHGPHDAWTHDDPAFLASAVELAGRLEGRVLTVELHNPGTHGFPTGFPGRVAELVVVTRDAGGTERSRHVERLGKVYVDEAGAPVPAAFATALREDTRLTAGERRVVSVPLPEGATSAGATLSFRLMPPKLAHRLGLADDPLGEPRVLHRRVWSIPEGSPGGSHTVDEEPVRPPR